MSPHSCLTKDSKKALISVLPSIFSVMTGIAILYSVNMALAGKIVLVPAVVFRTVLAARYYSKKKQNSQKMGGG
ncbi:MAG: hypothetical protein M3298_07605 [Thermoproteota archaeon]|nr:hypothetical protein [Thermoproteota archaeon]MDQ3808016.1 hypothetical protein [Thermoproteota archaeon]MDQ3882693.1 hypothetical protein [Thermoproteota archaeon]MDQ5843176.1 hypothetical protein [Thermoproteota archaeon]